ncbi:MAG: cytochrome C [Thermomicrobiales bacterium]|nr:cytochrome C [Thermomicrobiales bacterium]MCO5222004.1 cytochrome C [Thermomicrobiales bacterium]
MSLSSAQPINNARVDKPGGQRWAHLMARGRVAWVQIVLLLGAAGLLIGSIFFSYWQIILRAPQYPRGLTVDVYVNRLEDMRSVREVDGLNHYIGMIKLTDAASIERAISVYAILLIALLAAASTFLPGIWRTLARLPVIVYPLVFAVDLFGWLYYAGHSLDETAALSSSIKEFTPRIFGTGVIGQFQTEASFQIGFWLAILAALLALVAVLADWRAKRHAPVS